MDRSVKLQRFRNGLIWGFFNSPYVGGLYREMHEGHGTHDGQGSARYVFGEYKSGLQIANAAYREANYTMDPMSALVALSLFAAGRQGNYHFQNFSLVCQGRTSVISNDYTIIESETCEIKDLTMQFHDAIQVMPKNGL